MPGRKFQYVEPVWYPEDRPPKFLRYSSNEDETECLTITVSEEWIRQMYYPKWFSKMMKWAVENKLYEKEWPDLYYYFGFEHCLDDWIITHYAEEIK